MANNNVRNVQFLRNGTLFESRSAAKTALEAKQATLTLDQDGSIILARYQEGADPIKTLVGYVYYKDASNKSITIFDVDDAGSDVGEKIKDAIEKLDAEITSSDGTNVQVKVTEADGKITAVNITTDNTVNSSDVDTAIENAISDLDGSVIAETGYFVKSITEADGKISGTTEALPTVAAISVDGKPITAVSESLGAISATAGAINAEFVNIADSGSLITAETVEGALAEIAAEIDAMDLAVVSGDGEVITVVSEKDGKVSASKTAIKDVKLTGYVKNTTATGAISGNDDIEDALSKLENTIGSNAITNADGSITVTPPNGSTTDVKVHIKTGEKVIKLDGQGDGIYTDIDLVKITTGLPAEIKERYQLLASDDSQIGADIDIYKDSHIVSIAYDKNTQELVYTYLDVSGSTKETRIDLSELVIEAEFQSGVTATNHVVHGVVDSTSENFLTVGANGFKLAGVQDAIDTAISGLDAIVGSTTIATDKHVAVEVVEIDGKLTVLNINESNIADADDLAQEITGRQTADTALSNRLGDGVTAENTASAQLSALSGTAADASGVTSVWGAKKYAQQYADEKVADVVADLDADKSGSTEHIGVRVEEVDGVITAVTVSENDIANASDLTAEIAARKAVDGQSGQTYSANASSPYISGASNLNDADVKLAAALKSLSDETVNQVKVNGVALTEENNAVNAQISAAAGTGAETAAIEVNTNNSTGAVTISLLGLDCGTY